MKNAGQVTEEELVEYFKHIGSVVSCNVLKDKRTKSPGARLSSLK